MEFLTTLTSNVPEGICDATVEKMAKAEAVRVAELAAQGYCCGCGGHRCDTGSGAAWDRTALTTLPLHMGMTVEVTQLRTPMTQKHNKQPHYPEEDRDERTGTEGRNHHRRITRNRCGNYDGLSPTRIRRRRQLPDDHSIQ